MSDIVDLANGLEAEHLARSLARVSPDIPAGVAGECDECGEVMRRLVGGRCGFCRDGRRPPADRYPNPATIAEAAHQQEETYVTTIDSRKITIEGPALAAVDRLALASGISFKQAASELIASTSSSSYDVISDVPNDKLAAELVRRMGDGVSNDEHAIVVAERDTLVGERDAAVTRADAAEGQLAALKARIALLIDGARG